MLIDGLDVEAWSATLLVDDVPEVEGLAARASAHDVPVRFIEPMPLGLQGARRVPRLVRLLRAQRPDVFHAHLTWPLGAKYPLLAAIAARTPAVVGTVHLIPGFSLDRSNFLQLRALSAGVRYIAVSHDIATQLTGRFRWPDRNVRVIHNGVPAERFCAPASPDLREELTGGRPASVVLACGRLDPQKGYGLLLQAAAHVPDAVFVLAGSGPLRGMLEAQAAELGMSDRVRFLGFRTDVPALLAASDVFVLTSYYEGTSLSLLEAMAAGRAIVSSAIGGTDELIAHEESGLLFAAGDVDGLARALRRVLADEVLRAALGRRARERAKREFTPGAMVRGAVRVYEELLGEPTSA
jgi:glycosyltransferase involved in cell wall biosynthesis